MSHALPIQHISLLIGNSEMDPEPHSHPASDEKSSESEDSIDYYADDTPLPKAEPLDLKKLWLSNTDEVLRKFDEKLKEVKESQKHIEEGFRVFADNEKKYRVSSLRKVDEIVDRKQLYEDYLKKTRQAIEKLSPTLLMNIFSYVHEHMFLTMTRFRKVSKIFNHIYINSAIQCFLAQTDFLYEGAESGALKCSKEMCKKYMQFHKTFLYYKDIQYCEQIPQNSIMRDFEGAVHFINSIHKLVHSHQNRDFTYYSLMNGFMKKHRIVIGLSSLSLTSLILVRKEAIIAFSNYLAFNRSERSRDEITKTKYSKVIQVVEDEDYRDTLIINTKVSNYMWENYLLNFAVLITPGYKPAVMAASTWNILIFHLHNDLKTVYLKDVALESWRFSSARIEIEFSPDMSRCTFSTIEYESWSSWEATAKPMVSIASPQAQGESPHELEEFFSFCLFYRMEQYYLIASPEAFS